jgi:hypothetical protein
MAHSPSDARRQWLLQNPRRAQSPLGKALTDHLHIRSAASRTSSVQRQMNTGFLFTRVVVDQPGSSVLMTPLPSRQRVSGPFVLVSIPGNARTVPELRTNTGLSRRGLGFHWQVSHPNPSRKRKPRPFWSFFGSRGTWSVTFEEGTWAAWLCGVLPSPRRQPNRMQSAQ